MPITLKGKSRMFAFNTKLGWFGILHSGLLIQRIAIGYRSKQSICDREEFSDVRLSKPDSNETELIERFQAFATGTKVDFSNVKVDESRMSPFKKMVSRQCRMIPFGSSVTYGQLAELSGSPRAYRAVGSVMSNNPYPIIVPCHRVLAANGKLGGFSSPAGPKMKEQLLVLEGNRNWSNNKQATMLF